MPYISGLSTNPWVSTDPYFPGQVQGGQDYAVSLWTSTSDIVNPIATSFTAHAFSGTSGVSTVYTVDTSVAPDRFQVADTFGVANISNVIVSGLGSITFNGATTATINTARGIKSFVRISGESFYAY